MTATATDLIPVRALNQVTYCPRLYYLEYVESVMPINEHVEDGLFQHRRVDDPDLQHRTRREGRRPAHPQRPAQLRTPRHHRQARPGRGEGRRHLPRRVQTRQRPRRRQRPAALLGQRRHPALRPGPAAGGRTRHVTIPIGILYYIGSKTAGRGAARRRPPRQDAARHSHHPRAVRRATRRPNRCRPSCATAASAARWPRSASRRKRSTAWAAATCSPADADAARHHPRPAASRRRRRPLPPGARLPRRQTQRAPGRSQGRRGDPAHPASPPSARSSSSATCRSRRRPWRCLAAQRRPGRLPDAGYGRFVAALQPAPTKNVQLRVDQYRLFADPRGPSPWPRRSSGPRSPTSAPC